MSGSKALMEDYPDDEANSKKPKKPNTGKGKKPNLKHDEAHQSTEDRREGDHESDRSLTSPPLPLNKTPQ